MAMTDQDKTEAARKLADAMFQQAARVADANLDDLKAAVSAIDAVMNVTTDALASAHSTKKVEKAISDVVVAAVPTFTLADRGVAMAIWAMKRAGLS